MFFKNSLLGDYLEGRPFAFDTIVKVMRTFLQEKIFSGLSRLEEEMKRILLFMVFAVIFAFFLVNSALAQFLPPLEMGDDPGNQDTLYFVAGPPCSADAETLFFPVGGGDVTIYISVWNDEDITGITVPLMDLVYGPLSYAFLDSSKNNGAVEPLCFTGSRVEHFGAKACNLALNPPLVLYGAVTIEADPLSPGDGLFATVIYTVEDTGTICLDTLFFPPYNTLMFAYGLEPIGFVPKFRSKCFRLAPYLCGDANGDGLVNVVDLVYLVNYVFKLGPSPIFRSDVNCDDLVEVEDLVYLIQYVFKLGIPPCDPDNDGEPNCK